MERRSPAGSVGRAGGPDLTIYLHALRRHWLLSLGIGLLCAAIIGPAVWSRHGHQYTAAVDSSRDDAGGRVASQRMPCAVDRDRFEIYKSTQSNCC